jgi:hypothetical protein
MAANENSQVSSAIGETTQLFSLLKLLWFKLTNNTCIHVNLLWDWPEGESSKILKY